MRTMVRFAGTTAACLALLASNGCRDSTQPSDTVAGELSITNLGSEADGAAVPSEDADLAKRFRVAVLRTNEVEAITIIDMEKNEPIWMEWYPKGSDDADQICFCFQGKPVMELYLTTNAPPRRSVIYYDTNGLERVIVGDRSGVGMFTDRIFYEDGIARLEWWFNDGWHPVEERGNEKGIFLNGHWMRMSLSNGVFVPVLSE